MAGLGAGAGAFEGDQERARQAAERARLHEQQRQFDASLRQRRDEAQQAAAERAQNREDTLNMRAEDRDWRAQSREDTLNMRAEDRDWRAQESKRMQSNADRQFGLQAGGQEFSQQRAEKQDEWTKALDEQTMAKQKQEMEFASAKFNQWKTLADQEREELNQRKLLAQTGMASLMRLARDNGGVAPLKAVQAVGQELGLELEGAFFDNDGLFVVNAFKQDEQGQKVAVPNFFPPAIQAQMMRAMPGIFGEAAAKYLETSVADKREHEQALERDKLRYDSYAERKPTVVSAGDKVKLGALSDELKEAYDYLRYAAPEDKPQAQTHVDDLLAQIDAIEGGGQARPAQSPQSDIQTRAKQVKAEVVKKYGNTPRAKAEYERIMKMSMQGGR